MPHRYFWKILTFGEPAVTPSEWMTAIALLAGFIGWLTHISFAIGKMIAELHSINEKLGDQLGWIKGHESKIDDHERRISRLEYVTGPVE